MLELYYWPTPNGHKIPIMLEECGLEYRVRPVNILRGQQFKRSFLRINPNHKIPAIHDPKGPGGEPLTLFESGAILQYLAEKSGLFLPRKPQLRYETLQWLYFQVANVGPMFGQCGHFLGYAPRRISYAIERYRNETLRLYGVMDRRLRNHEYLAGEYSIADIATWPWVRVRWLHEIEINDFPQVARWYRDIARRPAVQRATGLLAERERIGNPDDKARASLFNSSSRASGRPARKSAIVARR